MLLLVKLLLHLVKGEANRSTFIALPTGYSKSIYILLPKAFDILNSRIIFLV